VAEVSEGGQARAELCQEMTFVVSVASLYSDHHSGDSHHGQEEDSNAYPLHHV
jgi:hypothetical protein